MKKMVLFTYRPEIGKIYYDDLSLLFGGYMEIRTCFLNEEEPSAEYLSHADIILVSNSEIINKIHYLIGEQAKIVTIDFSYPEMNIEQMRKFPAGTYALMCFDPFISRKMISLLYEQGINNFIWLYPREDGKVPDTEYDVVVVDDYSQNLFDDLKPVISLGNRKIAFSTLLKIAQEADIFNKELENMFLRYCCSYKGASTLVNNIYNDMSAFHSQIRLILDYIDSGIIILSERMEVVEYNSRFMDLFHVTGELYGKKIEEVPGTGELLTYIEKRKSYRNKLIMYPAGKASLVFNMECIIRGDNQGCNYMIILQEAEEIENKSHSLKRQLSTKGYTSKYRFSDIRTESPAMISCIKKAERIARIDKTTLIMGESGTGKELVATAIWKASDRRDNRFIAINCGAIPEPLLESELFGYVKGAFTGADPNGRMGKFELANKGVIFLDEIGDMPLYLQVKLLRVIQERKITRIGSNQVIPIDVRIIAATNKDLKEMMYNNKFREDLYYRLNVIPLKIAPLRERREDIRELVYYFAKRYASLFGKNLQKISEETMEHLYEYPWYGNIRELENTVEFMINMMEEDGVLNMGTLPANISEPQPGVGKTGASGTVVTDMVTPLRELERSEIAKAIRIYGNDTEGKKQAAKKLGIGLATLYRKMEGTDDTAGKR